MGRIRVLTIVGTRPEAIKLAPIIIAMEERSGRFESCVCATAQHRQMLDQALSPFGIKPDHDLDIMRSGQTLAEVTARAIEGLDRIVAEVQPEVILVQGDTTTAFCGALAAYYHRVKVGHVEAGLRTGDKFAPFPEEINRQLVARLADLHFAPTEHARATLITEGVAPETIFTTGNTVIDALLWMTKRVGEAPPSLPVGVSESLAGRSLVLITGHRRESFGTGFENICQAIRDTAEACPNTVFIYPVHLNPHVREPVNRILLGHPRIYLIEPVSYPVFVWLMNRADVVLTDSGGVQEEAPSLGKPVLVMRETTERPEGIDAGNAMLVGVQRERIASELVYLLRHPEVRKSMAHARNPYGDGHAASRIVDALSEML